VRSYEYKSIAAYDLYGVCIQTDMSNSYVIPRDLIHIVDVRQCSILRCSTPRTSHPNTRYELYLIKFICW